MAYHRTWVRIKGTEWETYSFYIEYCVFLGGSWIVCISLFKGIFDHQFKGYQNGECSYMACFNTLSFGLSVIFLYEMTKRFEDSLPYFRLVKSKGIQHAPAARGGIEDDIEDDQNVVSKKSVCNGFHNNREIIMLCV